ncbi:MAG: SCO2522 family protein [Actinoplanes sp.]
MTVIEPVFTEQSATPVVRAVALSQLSIELGHLYLDDFKQGPARLREQFHRVRPWVRTATEALTAGGSRVSTCFLIDDYFTRFASPAAVVRMLVEAAGGTGLEIDYVARESGCAVAGNVDLAGLVQQRLVAEPPVGTNGSRPPVGRTGWLSNGERSPSDRPVDAMAAPQPWSPPRQSAVQHHSIFVDIELWSETPAGRLWSCPFLAAVWQLQRLGVLRHRGEPIAEPQPMAPADLPDDWDAMPPVVQLRERAAPFRAYRTFSALDARFLGIEAAVRTILGQVSIDRTVTEQLRARAAKERLPLPEELVDRVRYAFL